MLKISTKYRYYCKPYMYNITKTVYFVKCLKMIILFTNQYIIYINNNKYKLITFTIHMQYIKNTYINGNKKAHN